MDTSEDDISYEPGAEYTNDELKVLIESGQLPESYFYGDDYDDWIEDED